MNLSKYIGKLQITIAKSFYWATGPFPRLFNFVSTNPNNPPAPINSVDLRNLFGPIRMQGQEDSCTAFATAAFREALWAIKHNNTLCSTLSTANLYWNIRDYPIIGKLLVKLDMGTSINRALKVLTNKGVCPESDMPYVAGQWNVMPSAVAVANEANFKIDNYFRVSPYNVDMLINVLNSGRPILIELTIWDSFQFYKGTDGLLTIPDTTKENYTGIHTMVLVGVDLTKKLWIVRNCWDITWGDKGYCYLPFGYEQYWLSAWSADAS